MLKLPIHLDFKRPLDPPKTPFGQCDRCHYVSTDVASKKICPICKATHQQGYNIWPDPNLEELWKDEVAMWNEKRVELSAIVAAMYFESSVFHLIYWGTVWLDPELNWLDSKSEGLPDIKRIWTYLNSIRSYEKTNKSLKRLFGCDGQEMLKRVLGQNCAQFFWDEYRKLAEYRNKVIHKGVRSKKQTANQSSSVSASTDKRLDWCLKFIPICWNVFAKLHNEFIHKPMWERKQNNVIDLKTPAD